MSRYLLVIFCCVCCANIFAQSPYSIRYKIAGKDTTFSSQPSFLKSVFPAEQDAHVYVDSLEATLIQMGYLSASVDEAVFDTAAAFVELYLGQKWDVLRLGYNLPQPANGRIFKNTPQQISFAELQNLETRILRFYNGNGYPFAKVYLDSVNLSKNEASGTLTVDAKSFVSFDSLVINGTGRVSNRFLMAKLGLEKGAPFNADKIESIPNALKSISYLQMSDAPVVRFLPGGAQVTLNLSAVKKSSVDALLGLQPGTANERSSLVYDIHLDLRNLFNGGETIRLNASQLQRRSPEVNFGFEKENLFGSRWGAGVGFSLYKRDSSFLQVDAALRSEYSLNTTAKAHIGVNFSSNTILQESIDTFAVKATRKLPVDIDFSNVAINAGYSYSTIEITNSPASGFYVQVLGAVGRKKILPNNLIRNLKDGAFAFSSLYDSIGTNHLTSSLSLVAVHFKKLGKISVLKTGLNTAYYNSKFMSRNELYRIGGFTLLRGFDEGSIFTSLYAVGTVEYRLLISPRSFLYGFVDGGFAKNDIGHSRPLGLAGTGLGLSFETKAGILNLGLAAGKRSDLPFDLREAARLHFGYSNYF